MEQCRDYWGGEKKGGLPSGEGGIQASISNVSTALHQRCRQTEGGGGWGPREGEPGPRDHLGPTRLHDTHEWTCATEKSERMHGLTLSPEEDAGPRLPAAAAAAPGR